MENSDLASSPLPVGTPLEHILSRISKNARSRMGPPNPNGGWVGAWPQSSDCNLIPHVQERAKLVAWFRLPYLDCYTALNWRVLITLLCCGRIYLRTWEHSLPNPLGDGAQHVQQHLRSTVADPYSCSIMIYGRCYSTPGCASIDLHQHVWRKSLQAKVSGWPIADQ